MAYRLFGIFVAWFWVSVACAAPSDCLQPPLKYGGQIALQGCVDDKGVKACVYQFGTEFPKNEYWLCAIVLTQRSCRLPFEAAHVVCSPAKPPVKTKV